MQPQEKPKFKNACELSIVTSYTLVQTINYFFDSNTAWCLDGFDNVSLDAPRFLYRILH